MIVDVNHRTLSVAPMKNASEVILIAVTHKLPNLTSLFLTEVKTKMGIPDHWDASRLSSDWETQVLSALLLLG